MNHKTKPQTVKQLLDDFGRCIGYVPDSPSYPAGRIDEFIDEAGYTLRGRIGHRVNVADEEAARCVDIVFLS